LEEEILAYNLECNIKFDKELRRMAKSSALYLSNMDPKHREMTVKAF